MVLKIFILKLPSNFRGKIGGFTQNFAFRTKIFPEVKVFDNFLTAKKFKALPFRHPFCDDATSSSCCSSS